MIYSYVCSLASHVKLKFEFPQGLMPQIFILVVINIEVSEILTRN